MNVVSSCSVKCLTCLFNAPTPLSLQRPLCVTRSLAVLTLPLGPTTFALRREHRKHKMKKCSNTVVVKHSCSVKRNDSVMRAVVAIIIIVINVYNYNSVFDDSDYA